MELRVRSLLTLMVVWDCLSVAGLKYKTQSDVYEADAQELSRKHQTNINLQIRPETSLHICAGETLTLHCRDEGHQALSQSWQTPFGRFDGCDPQNKDPLETCNGTLRISRATSSHDGLYFCLRLDETRKTIVPYRVHVEALKPDVKKHLRTIRETEVDPETVSESHFAAAVASSVIVSFVVAFALGALSRSYVITCLRTIRVRIPKRKSDRNDISVPNSLQTTRGQHETVLFKKSDTGEDTVDVGLVNRERGNAENVENGGNDESNRQAEEGEEQPQDVKSVASPHPKKKIRVIKVYNYDEDGNPYSHIKDSGMEHEDEVRPKLRTRSLTRLDAIMKQAESMDFSPVGDLNDGQRTQPDENSDTRVSQTSQDTHL